MRLYGDEPVQPFDFEEEDEIEDEDPEQEEENEPYEYRGISTILCVNPVFALIKRYRIWKYGEEKTKKIEEKNL